MSEADLPEDEPDDGRPGPRVYSIAAHRGFADALVAGLVPRYSEADLGLARLTLLLPSRRSARTVTEAFVRLGTRRGDGAGGMLLPRMAVVGDLDLDETLGALLDPLGAGAAIAPAADPTRRWLLLADYLRTLMTDRAPQGAALLRLAQAAGRTIDRLQVEGIASATLLSDEVIGLVGEQAAHWRAATRDFLALNAMWQSECAARGEIDAPARRNLLFAHAAQRWTARQPPHPIVAAGITNASPALAKLLRVVASLPRGAVILPDLDLSLGAAVWDELGVAGAPDEPGGAPFGRGDAVTHPQYHLKFLLNRMGIGRDEVLPWHRAGIGAAPPARSRAISNLFLPSRASAGWVSLPAEQRRLAGVRLLTCDHPGEEAQAIAILIREALETPEKRVALVTSDRALASRVVAHLRRWNIVADDTAGLPLAQTPAGRVLLLIAGTIADRAAPVPLLALLGHPLVGAGEGRPAWLEQVRALDLALRGPRPDAGLASIRAAIENTARNEGGAALRAWWSGVETVLARLFADNADEPKLAASLDAMVVAAEALCGETLWSNNDGRALAAMADDLRAAALDVGTTLATRELPAMLRNTMDQIAVRPTWGGHSRVAIYGLIEARMVRADLMICAALHEGSWPGRAAPDPLLPPPVLRALGVPGADFRIGLAAHDLAAALGAPEVVLSLSHRDAAGPVIPSRFVLRVRALLGDRLLRDEHTEGEALRLARAIDRGPAARPSPRPAPRPSQAQRDVPIAVTALDRLRGDPYQFYAGAILNLRSLDALDAEPSAAWKGTAVHEILRLWHQDGGRPGELVPIALRELDAMTAHPLMRSLWRPRLIAALEWIEAEIVRLTADGRAILASERKGEITYKGVRIHGRADRIDALPGGDLAIVDYKTGGPPSPSQVEQGFALQLGLIGLMARHGGFEGLGGEPGNFEYWSMGKSDKSDTGFGYMVEPIKEGRRLTGIPRDDFLPETERYLADAIDRFIKGDQPFTARLEPDYVGYNDYDQLMRLDEWLARDPDEGAA